MSVIEFFFPGMCKSVSGNTLFSFNRNANARRKCAATSVLFVAIWCTQDTVGLLSLNKAQ